MSRTKKGSKEPGSEHWSRRPKSFKDDKNLTVRAERRSSGEEIVQALKEIYFPKEYKKKK